MIVNDYNAWPDRAAIYQGNRAFGAVIGVLLRWRMRTLGVLYVDDKVGREFTKQDAQLLSLFADQAAVALGTDELLTRDVERLKRLENISVFTTKLMTDLHRSDLSDRLGLIAQYTATILQAETAGIFLVRRPGFLLLEASGGTRKGCSSSEPSSLCVRDANRG